MSNDQDPKSSKRVGYGKPPTAHQFKKGESGNNKGRPRKMERSFTSGQIRHDILHLMEERVEISVAGKKQRVPVIVAVYWQLLAQALKGDRRAMIEVVKLRETLVNEHKVANWDLIAQLERTEKLFKSDDAIAALPSNTVYLNKKRKKTREM